MKQIDEKNLDAAITVGISICKELGICCDQRGRVIYQIYQKLEELKSAKPATSAAVGIVDSDQAEAEKPED